MIDATTFLERARAKDLSWYAGVPCSFLGPLIDAMSADESIDHIGAANEGDAVAMAAGAFLGGRRGVVFMQNSGLGNAVSPLTSLTWPFRIPVLLLVTLRGDPAIRDEPQHELMGAITLDLLDRMQVPWAEFPRDGDEIEDALARADEHLCGEQRPYALVVRKGAFAKSGGGDRIAPTARCTAAARGRTDAVAAVATHEPLAPRRCDALRRIVDRTGIDGTVVIAATGYTGRELCAIDDRSNHLYMVGSMGCAASLGLGLARARPDLQVVVIDGDGGALMRMGNFATVGAYAGPNLVHIVLDNGAHESTGGQATVSGRISFAGVAAACGYRVTPGDGLDAVDHVLADDSRAGPRFLHLPIRPGVAADLPRPRQTPRAVRERLMGHIGSLSIGRAHA